MSEQIRRYREYAASRNVLGMIAAPFYLRALWSVGVEVKPSLLRACLLLAALEMAVKLSLALLINVVLYNMPKSAVFFTDPYLFFGSVVFSIFVMLPVAYIMVKGHRNNLESKKWEDFAGDKT